MKYTADDYAQLLLDMLSESSLKEQKGITHQFVQVLKSHHQGALLPDIIAAFVKLLDRQQKVLVIHLFSAKPLHNLEQLSLIISQELKKDVSLRNFVKPELLGGLIIRFQDYKIDFSIKSHLGKIKLQTLTAAPQVSNILKKIISIITTNNQILFQEDDNKTIKPKIELISVATGARQKLSVLEKKFSAALHQKVIIDYHKDPKLIGGIIVKYGDIKIDNSVKSKINK